MPGDNLPAKPKYGPESGVKDADGWLVYKPDADSPEVATLTGPEGHKFSVDKNGVHLKNPDGSSMYFDSEGHLLEQADARGQRQLHYKYAGEPKEMVRVEIVDKDTGHITALQRHPDGKQWMRMDGDKYIGNVGNVRFEEGQLVVNENGRDRKVSELLNGDDWLILDPAPYENRAIGVR